jgi:preprotein translocase subunit SecY
MILEEAPQMVFPKLEEMAKEGESGRIKINQYARMITVPGFLPEGSPKTVIPFFSSIRRTWGLWIRGPWV